MANDADLETVARALKLYQKSDLHEGLDEILGVLDISKDKFLRHVNVLTQGAYLRRGSRGKYLLPKEHVSAVKNLIEQEKRLAAPIENLTTAMQTSEVNNDVLMGREQIPKALGVSYEILLRYRGILIEKGYLSRGAKGTYCLPREFVSVATYAIKREEVKGDWELFTALVRKEANALKERNTIFEKTSPFSSERKPKKMYLENKGNEETKRELDFVRKVAFTTLKKLGLRRIDVDDLMSEGWLGYQAAMRNFDPSLGRTLDEHLEARVGFAIRKALRKEQNPLIDNEYRRGQRRRREKVTKAIEKELGREPQLEEIAEKFDLTADEFLSSVQAYQPSEIVELERISDVRKTRIETSQNKALEKIVAAEIEISTDYIVGSNLVLEGYSHTDQLSEQIDERKKLEQVKEAIATLSPQDQLILELRTQYYLSFPQIGYLLDTHQNSAKRSYKKIVEKLKERVVGSNQP